MLSFGRVELYLCSTPLTRLEIAIIQPDRHPIFPLEIPWFSLELGYTVLRQVADSFSTVKQKLDSSGIPAAIFVVWYWVRKKRKKEKSRI